MATVKSSTDLEQSKKLAKILPLESADNVIVSFGSREGTKTVVMPKETLDVIRTPFDDIRETTMCWSLAALFGILPILDNRSPVIAKTFDGKYRVTYHSTAYEKAILTSDYDNPIDACVEMIEKLN